MLACRFTLERDAISSERYVSNLRSIGENALHLIGCRASWFTEFLGEDGGEEMKAYAGVLTLTPLLQ